MSEQQHELLTVAEVAARLRVSDQTVYRWIRNQRIEGIRIGENSWRVRATSVSELLTGDTQRGTVEA